MQLQIGLLGDRAPTARSKFGQFMIQSYGNN